MSFRTYEKGPDFDRAREQISTPFQYFDVDLSVARQNVVINIAGDFLYIDASSTGEATLELNNQHDAASAPFLVQSGFAIRATFKQLKLSNTAQAGKTLRVLYSTGEQVIPVLSGQIRVTLTGVTSPTLSNENCAAAATEYSKALAAATKRFTLKARGGQVKIAYVAAASGTVYILLEDGQSLTEQDINGAVTVYFQSPTAGTVLEVLQWA